MGRLFIEGFEAGDLRLWSQSGLAGYEAAVTTGISGMTGNYCLDLGTAYAGVVRDISGEAEVYCAFRYKRRTSGFSYLCSFLYNGTILGVLLVAGANGPLYFQRGSTTIVTGTTNIATDQVCHIEVRYKPDSVSGVVQVKLDQTLELDFSGNTSDGGSVINTFGFGSTIGEAYFAEGYIDDIVLDDAGWIGNSKIAGIKPNATGNSTQWTPSAGNNWECVDDIPPGFSDYIKTNTVDKLDTYGLSDLTGSIQSIESVQVEAWCGKSGVPTPGHVQLGLRTNSNNYFSGNVDIPMNDSRVLNIWENNPYTGLPWTVSDVNSLEAGIKSVS